MRGWRSLKRSRSDEAGADGVERWTRFSQRRSVDVAGVVVVAPERRGAPRESALAHARRPADESVLLPGGGATLLSINGVSELFTVDAKGERVGSYEDSVFLKTRADRYRVTPLLIPVTATLQQVLRCAKP